MALKQKEKSLLLILGALGLIVLSSKKVRAKIKPLLSEIKLLEIEPKDDAVKSQKDGSLKSRVKGFFRGIKDRIRARREERAVRRSGGGVLKTLSSLRQRLRKKRSRKGRRSRVRRPRRLRLRRTPRRRVSRRSIRRSARRTRRRSRRRSRRSRRR